MQNENLYISVTVEVKFCSRPWFGIRYNGRWICGLCIEAVKYEVLRSQMLITTEEALNRHVDFCRKFRSLSGETEDPISAIGRILRRSLHSPRSTPSSPMRESRRTPLIRCESCFSSISRWIWNVVRVEVSLLKTEHNWVSGSADLCSWFVCFSSFFYLILSFWFLT